MKISVKMIKDFFVGIIDFFVDSVSDYDERTGEEKFSLGRGSWIVWFYSTIYFTFNAITLTPYWYMVGLSTLAYVIGTKFMITSFGSLPKVETPEAPKDEAPPIKEGN